ncbi:MAG: hypothetical protein ACLGP3_01210 [Acidobacteriota bacterium]
MWKKTAKEEASDYMNLFRRDAPWSRAATHVRVFKTLTQFLTFASDEQLRQMFADLRQRQIALAVEALMQTGTGGCGWGVEGYSAPNAMESLALRVKRLGGVLNYVAMDEPLWFGHRYSGPHACRSSIAAVANDVARKAAAIRRVFPNVQVGDIEPYAVPGQPGDWLDEIAQWIAIYRAATGENLAFLDTDMDWHVNWRPQLAALVPVLKATGIKFGIIYNGDAGDTTGLTWTRHAEEHFVAVESDPTLVPDQAILQTWMRHPSRNLPESQPGTMTWLVNRYAAAPTRLTLQRVGDRLEGQLTGPVGKPLAGQRVQVLALDANNAGPPADRTLSDTVPEGAVSALFILRINAECGCSGPVNVTLGPLRYRDDRTGQEIVRTFAVPGSVRTAAGTHIVAAAGRKFVPNSPPWKVTPGDKWTIHVPMGAAEDSTHSGYVALLFLRKDRREVSRIPLPFEPATQPLGEVTTDTTGRFALAPSASVVRLNPGFRVEFAGSDSYRLSIAAVR